MVADDLRRQADDFIELSELAPLIARNPSERPRHPEPSPTAVMRRGPRIRALMRSRLTVRWLRRRFEEPPLDCRRAVPGSSPSSARAAGPVSRLEERAGPLVRRHRRAQLLIVEAWRRACTAAPTAPASRSPATMPAISLYSTLLKYGFAKGTYKADPNDGLRLVDCAHRQRRALPAAGEQAAARRVHTLPDRSCRPRSP